MNAKNSALQFYGTRPMCTTCHTAPAADGTSYCGQTCRLACWKVKHKKFCTIEDDESVEEDDDSDSESSLGDEPEPAADGKKCLVCLESLDPASARTLPCSHAFHPGCIEDLTAFGINHACRPCQPALRSGPEALFVEATWRFFELKPHLRRTVDQGGASWGPLTEAQQREMAEVVVAWRAAAEHGILKASHNLGVACAGGLGTEQNFKEAARWHLLAAQNGDAHAQLRWASAPLRLVLSTLVPSFQPTSRLALAPPSSLGFAYFKAKGVPRSPKDGMRWYRKAADQGLADAQYEVGAGYSNGEGVPKNFREAVRWYRKAAEQGHAQAERGVGLSYELGQGVPQNFRDAVRWYHKAADKGDPSAQFSLGCCYANGEGVPQSLPDAVKWCRLAAAQGHSNAQRNLGISYQAGQGVAQDFAEAAKWHKLAAEGGNGEFFPLFLLLRSRLGSAAGLDFFFFHVPRFFLSVPLGPSW